VSAPQDGDLAAVLAGARGSHERLLATVDTLAPGDVATPSLLPGWTVGHVLTHLARNADSHTRMLRGALRGEHLEQYAGGHEQRAADIEDGARREPRAVIDDARVSVDRLEATWGAMTDDAWAGHGLSLGRPWPCRQTVFHRWREVEIHHVDLGRSYGPADWPDDYVAVELPAMLAQLPERLDGSDSRALLAWLTGRGSQPSTMTLAAWQSVRYGRGGPFSGP